jgi:dUTP pyrophosphatase
MVPMMLENPKILVQVLPHGVGLAMPTYSTPGSVGADLVAALGESVTLEPLHRLLIPTGLTLEIPIGFEAQIRPRSGLALKNGITVLNTPGTIDPDFRGEVQILLWNSSPIAFTLERGMRIAQMVIARSYQGDFVEAEKLSITQRHTGGFGSTGL